MQTDNTYQDFEKTIQDIENYLSDHAEKMKELISQKKEARARLEHFETSWNAEKSKIDKIAYAESLNHQERIQKAQELSQKREDLKARIYKDKLEELISEQPSFEDALRSQIEKFSEERMSGLSFEKESETSKITEGILERMTRRDFSIQTTDWRAAKGHYETVLRELCDARLQKRKISSQAAHFRFQAILQCLTKQEAILFDS